MNNAVFLMVTLVVNILAIVLVYQFIKKLEKRDIFIFIAICYAIIYGLVTVIYWISGIGIESTINDMAKDSIVFLFVPINVIVLIPFVANRYSKYKNNKINKRDFLGTVIKICFVAIIILFAECVYFKNVKQNIIQITNNMTEANSSNSVTKTTNEIKENYTNSITNTVDSVITNTMVNSINY